MNNPLNVMKCYIILDDHSNSSFVDPKVVKQLQVEGIEQSFLLKTLSSGLKTRHDSLLIHGLRIRGINQKKHFDLPPFSTSDFIHDSKDEVATPNMVKLIPHQSHLARHFLDLDQDAEVLLLLGRDSGDLMKTVCYGDRAPFVFETHLGWAVVGSICRNSPKDKHVFRTSLEHLDSKICFPDKTPKPQDEIFQEYKDDDTPAPSYEDAMFKDIVENRTTVNANGYIVIPLPFKKKTYIPNNMNAVYHRTLNTLKKIKTNGDKLKQCIEAMKNHLEAGHIEEVPKEELIPLRKGRAWWLPVFVVTHPKKLKHRVVFDGSAQYQNISFNSLLLQGPDENNRLRGVLMRFRKGEIAFSGDIQSMFYNFFLPDEDKDFARFFWFKGNNPDNGLAQFRGCVHLFGNRSSPAVAHHGLIHTVRNIVDEENANAVNFIKENIYVDDGLGCSRSVSSAVEILKNVRKILGKFNIKLHKLISNNIEVNEQFPPSERANLMEVSIGEEIIHRTLGMAWEISSDSFLIKVNLPSKPFTRRGLLATNNSVFDPLGIVNPVLLKGKLIQRKAMIQSKESPVDWDSPLPNLLYEEWKSYVDSLKALSNIRVPRSYFPLNFGRTTQCELHIFADASEVAIGSVAYLKLIDEKDVVGVSYIISASKLTPRTVTSIPRLELCAAVLAAKLCYEIIEEIKWEVSRTFLYSDSKVVIAYLMNEEKRFDMYVTRRVKTIKKLTANDQWIYVNSELNSADIACRPHDVWALMKSCWITGPSFLQNVLQLPEPCNLEDIILPGVIEEKRVLNTLAIAHGPSPMRERKS